jgi:CRISPR system Cascade subunit CasE
MYLSCYSLDLRSSEVRRALKSSYEMHRTVMSAFRSDAGEAPRENMNILYRLIVSGKQYRLYVSSAELPISEMPQGFNKLPGSPKDLSRLKDVFDNGQIYCFDLMAAPTKKIDVPSRKNSKRVFLCKREEREAWLRAKAAQNGFELLSFIEETQVDNKLKKGGYNSVVFKGVLKITDKEKFLNAYQKGIGAEKAFGCGMLLLSPSK